LKNPVARGGLALAGWRWRAGAGGLALAA